MDRGNPDAFLQACFESEQTQSKNRHHWNYNEASLKKLLSDHGFAEASRCAYRQGRCAGLERIDNRPENSLYVEAIR